jgi:hypothetical protein
MYNLRTRDKILCGMNVGYRGETQRGDSEGEELEGGMEWRGEV